MKIKELFIELTSSTTCPYQEDKLIDFLQSILPETYLDSFNNLHCIIGDAKTLFVSHLDNHCDKIVKVNHVFEDDYIKTDHKSILGADDKAGVSVLIYMIHHNIPGHYVFFRAEEDGCIGSLDYKKKNFASLVKYSHCVAFDRKGTTDMIYCQNDINTASSDFADFLSNEFKRISKNTIQYQTCDKGGLTDSGTFKYIIPECVNLAVGYYNNHTVFEKQNLKFLTQVAETAIKIDWQNLPVFRQIPNLREIIQIEQIVIEQRRQIEIKNIEAELGFSLY